VRRLSVRVSPPPVAPRATWRTHDPPRPQRSRREIMTPLLARRSEQSSTSGLSASVVMRISERGARMARHDDGRIGAVFDGRATMATGMPPPQSRATNNADRSLHSVAIARFDHLSIARERGLRRACLLHRLDQRGPRRERLPLLPLVLAGSPIHVGGLCSIVHVVPLIASRKAKGPSPVVDDGPLSNLRAVQARLHHPLVGEADKAQ
jgi:hypothetical protein